MWDVFNHGNNNSKRNRVFTIGPWKKQRQSKFVHGALTKSKEQERLKNNDSKSLMVFAKNVLKYIFKKEIMDLKWEISMLLDYANTHHWSFIIEENYIWFSNLVYHKFMSWSVSSIEKFIWEVIWWDNAWVKFKMEIFPKIQAERQVVWDMKAFNVYWRVNSRDHVWVEHLWQEIMIDMQLYKKVRKMINDSDLPENEIGVSVYEQNTWYFLIVIHHREDPIFILWAVWQPKQASLFDKI